jgi:hypothetical protein
MLLKEDVSSDAQGNIRDIAKDPIVLNDVTKYTSNHPVFLWPQHANTVEEMRGKLSNISYKTSVTLKELDLYQEEDTTKAIKHKVSEAASICSRNIKKRIWFKFDIFMARGRPGLEVEGMVEEIVQKKKKKRSRKSRVGRKARNENDGEKESFIQLLQSEERSSVQRAV